jgi:hypothetical protein
VTFDGLSRWRDLLGYPRCAGRREQFRMLLVDELRPVHAGARSCCCSPPRAACATRPPCHRARSPVSRRRPKHRLPLPSADFQAYRVAVGVLRGRGRRAHARGQLQHVPDPRPREPLVRRSGLVPARRRERHQPVYAPVEAARSGGADRLSESGRSTSTGRDADGRRDAEGRPGARIRAVPGAVRYHDVTILFGARPCLAPPAAAAAGVRSWSTAERFLVASGRPPAVGAAR